MTPFPYIHHDHAIQIKFEIFTNTVHINIESNAKDAKFRFEFTVIKIPNLIFLF